MSEAVLTVHPETVPEPSAPETALTPKKRVAALDQFRGYTMAGMFLVNFVGGYAAVHPVFGHHHTYCSYADTIMPQFFFAAGFAFRLTYQARRKEYGTLGAINHALYRNFKLFVIGFIAYNLGNFGEFPAAVSKGEAGDFLLRILQHDTFQALVHIAFASVFVLPVIGMSSRVRWAALVFCGLLHTANLHFFYYDFAHNGVTDGGPLGFVGWAIPTLAGTLVCDAVRADRSPLGQWKRMWWWAVLLMVVGYGLACLNLINNGDPAATGLSRYLVAWPFTPPTRPVDMWTMDQQIASPSYMVFSAGFSIAVYLFFVLVSDAWGITVGVFRTLGKNPLFGYLYSGVVAAVMEALFERVGFSRESSLAMVLLVFGIVFFIDWATLRFMEYKGWFWKL